MNKAEFLSRNPGWNPNSWYIPDYVKSINAQGVLTDSELDRRTDSYFEWFESKHGRSWNRALDTFETEGSSEPRKPLLKPEKIMGYRDGLPVIIRTVSAQARCVDYMRPALGSCGGWKDDETRAQGEALKHRTVAPGLYTVIHNGKRVDGFLKLENAKKCVSAFIAAGG